MKMSPEPDARTVDVAGTAQATKHHFSITRLVSSPRRARDATICMLHARAPHADSRQEKLVNGRQIFKRTSMAQRLFSTAPGVAHRHRSHPCGACHEPMLQLS